MDGAQGDVEAARQVFRALAEGLQVALAADRVGG